MKDKKHNKKVVIKDTSDKVIIREDEKITWEEISQNLWEHIFDYEKKDVKTLKRTKR